MKIRMPSEVVYLLANVLLAAAVCLVTAADFGVSMIVAPAYILSQKLGFLTFGQCEYVLQALVFVVLCLLLRRIRGVYFVSFGTCLFYGAVLDLLRAAVPLFNPAVTPPGSMAMPIRLLLFAGGMLLSSFAVSLFFHTYLYPQVYDFFVKGVSRRFHLPLSKFKTGFDLGCLAVASVMTLLFFRRFVGVGVGTLVIACINGTLIGAFHRLVSRWGDFFPLFPRAAAYFNRALLDD